MTLVRDQEHQIETYYRICPFFCFVLIWVSRKVLVIQVQNYVVVLKCNRVTVNLDDKSIMPVLGLFLRTIFYIFFLLSKFL